MDSKKPDKKIDLKKIDLKNAEQKIDVKNLDKKSKIIFAITIVMCILFGIIAGIIGATSIYAADKYVGKYYPDKTWVFPVSCFTGVIVAMFVSLFIAIRFGALFGIFGHI